jgi:hypothetical protein
MGPSPFVPRSRPHIKESVVGLQEDRAGMRSLSTPTWRVASTLRKHLRNRSRAILDGVEKDEEEIFPDPMSAAIAEAGVAVPPRRCNASSPPMSSKRRLNRRASAIRYRQR